MKYHALFVIFEKSALKLSSDANYWWRFMGKSLFCEVVLCVLSDWGEECGNLAYSITHR